MPGFVGRRVTTAPCDDHFPFTPAEALTTHGIVCTVINTETTPYFRNTVQPKRPYVTVLLCREVIANAVF